MRPVTLIEFDEAEREEFVRALCQATATLPDTTDGKGRARNPVKVHLNRIREHREPYGHYDLLDLASVLARLIGAWEPGMHVSYWEDLGAPGAAETLTGLALERQMAVERAERSLLIVAEALGRVTSDEPADRYAGV